MLGQSDKDTSVSDTAFHSGLIKEAFPRTRYGGAKPATPVAWEDHDPGAAYITIAPMHLKEALWTKIARPIPRDVRADVARANPVGTQAHRSRAR